MVSSNWSWIRKYNNDGKSSLLSPSPRSPLFENKAMDRDLPIEGHDNKMDQPEELPSWAAALIQQVQQLTQKSQHGYGDAGSSVNIGNTQQTPSSSIAPQASVVKTKATYPKPDKFDGTKSKYRTWLQEMKNKLEADGQVIGDTKDQFNYIYACLASQPQRMVISFVESGGSHAAYDPQDFLNYLTIMFTDPNEKARALDRLRSLYQAPNESFATFIPKFEREILDAGGTNWTDEVCINYLDGALNNKLHQALLSIIQIPQNYHEYVQLLHTLGSRLDGMEYSRKRYMQHNTEKQSNTKTPITQASAATEESMDWEPTKANRTLTKEDKALQGKRAKWVSREEMAARQKEQRCFRCGRSRCYLQKCPLLPARPPTEIKRVRAAEVTEAAVEDEQQEGQDSSGNEELLP
jgi:hypothetical protein